MNDKGKSYLSEINTQFAIHRSTIKKIWPSEKLDLDYRDSIVQERMMRLGCETEDYCLSNDELDTIAIATIRSEWIEIAKRFSTLGIR